MHKNATTESGQADVASTSSYLELSMMATTYSRATVGLPALFTIVCWAVPAAAQATDGEIRYGTPQPSTWPSDNYYSSQPLSDASVGGVTTAESRPSGQYQRGKAIGINIVDAGQGKVVITYVHPESPAEQAGLQQGDAIRRVDGRRVSSTLDVIQYISQLPAHDRVNLEVERAQRMQFFQVRLASPPKTLVRGRGDGPEVQFSSQQNIDEGDGSYAYQAQYGARTDSDGYRGANVAEYRSGSPSPTYVGAKRAGSVPSNRALMEEISELRRQLSEVRLELEELRQQVESPPRRERRAQDLQPREPSPRTEEFPYDGF